MFTTGPDMRPDRLLLTWNRLAIQVFTRTVLEPVRYGTDRPNGFKTTPNLHDWLTKITTGMCLCVRIIFGCLPRDKNDLTI